MLGLLIFLITTLASQVSCQGDTLSLNGLLIENDSYVNVGDIDEGNNSLLCNIESTECCSGDIMLNNVNQEGQWYYPNGSIVITDNEIDGFYQVQDLGVVRLYRRGNPLERGKFYCNISDSENNNHRLFANIVAVTDLKISPPDVLNGNFGDCITVLCSVDIDHHPIPLNDQFQPFEWFFDHNNELLSDSIIVSPVTINGTSFTSSIHFPPLQESHAGVYTCQIKGNPMLARSTILTVISSNMSVYDQNIRVEVIENGKPLLGLSNYSLICNVTGNENVNYATIKYEWTHNQMNGGQDIVRSNSDILFFPSLRISDNEVYTCIVTVCPYFMNDTNEVSASHKVNVQIPLITTKILSSKERGIPLAGEKYNLSCDVNGAENINNSIITYKWKMTNESSEKRELANFTSHLIFSPLKTSDGGNYSCEAVIMQTYLNETVTVESVNTWTLQIQIPDSVSINVTSDPASPIRPVGTDVTLTCTVELSPAVDVPVTVNTEWSGPDEFNTIDSTQPVMGSTTTYAKVTSFGRNQSGLYNCTATVGSAFSFLRNNSQSETARVTTGVYLSHNETVLVVDSAIYIYDIGPILPYPPVMCTTDKIPCCKDSPRYGEWKFPNGSLVKPFSLNPPSFLRNRENDGSVNLFRRSFDSVSPTGTFCCEVPDATDTNQILCVNVISDLSVQINDGGTIPVVGETYTLTCSVSELSYSISNAVYRWEKNGSLFLGNIQTLNFSSIRLSDAGWYTCIISVGSLSNRNQINIALQIPPPLSVTMDSSLPNPIRPVGSDVTLTCTVVLPSGQEFDEQVTVNIQLSGPDPAVGPLVTTTSSISGSTYTSTAVVSSFEREESGLYNCTATVSSPSLFLMSNSLSETTRVTTGVYLSHNETVLVADSAIYIFDIGPILPYPPVMCTTDKIPCCKDPPRYGEWKFPNGSLVKPFSLNPSSFLRNRENDGSVNLFRYRHKTMSPTGTFCCEVPDATDTNQTLCVNVISDLSVQINNGETVPMVGETYTLTCSVSELSYSISNAVYRWEKNGSLFLGNIQTLNFSSLRLSDAGWYTCIISVGSLSNQSQINIALQIPPPLSVTIDSSLPNPIRPVGSEVTLTCTVVLRSGPEFDEQVTVNIQLSGPDPAVDPLVTTTPSISGSTYTSTAVVSSFEREESGLYNCTATVSSPSLFLMSNSLSETTRITTGSLKITGSGSTPTVGQNYSLTCLVPGGESAISYQWRKNNKVENSNTASTYTFVPLRLSDAGQYTCTVNVGSTAYSDDKDLFIKLTTPMVSLTISNMTLYAGTTVSMTCNVIIDSTVDSNVSVDVSWYRENTELFNDTSRVSISTTFASSPSFISILTLFPLSDEDNTTFTCKALAYSQDRFITNSNANMAEILIPVSVRRPSTPSNVTVKANTSTTLKVTWSQQPDDFIQGYYIMATYIGLCTVPDNVTNITISDPSMREIDIGGLEEHSNYSIVITAFNSAGSVSSASKMFTTGFSAPDGHPISVNTASVNLTSITITWEPVNCIQQNSIITSYIVSYFSNGFSAGSSIITNVTEAKIVNLNPNTEYTFKVRAVSENNLIGPPAALTSKTRVPRIIRFLLNDHFYGNNSVISSIDIGSNASALFCLTNDTTCCSGDGNWYLPTNDVVQLMGSSGDIYQVRNQNVVRLNKRESVTLPSGVFRCSIPDADGQLHNIFIGVYPKVPGAGAVVEKELIFDKNIQVLSCVSTGGPPTIVTWMKDGLPLRIGTAKYSQTQEIVNTSTSTYNTKLFINSTDHNEVIGNYTCTVNNSRVTSKFNQSLTVEIQGIRITGHESALPHGSSALLNCTIDLAVDTIQWLDNNGTVLANGTDTFLELITEASSSVYTCKVKSSFGSQMLSIFLHLKHISRSLFQLRLTGLNNCPQWVTENTDLKLEKIADTLLENINALCQCGLVRRRLTSEVFQCFTDSPQAVTYRAVLHETTSASSSEIISHIEQWTTEGAVVTIQRVVLQVDGSCVVGISSLSDKECQLRISKQSTSSDLVGGSVGAVVIVIVIIITCVVACAVLLARKYKFQIRNTSDKREHTKHAINLAGNLEDLDTKDPVYELTETVDHHYEGIDQYHHQDYEIVQQSSTIQQSAGDYELAQCPAYGAISTK